MKSTVFFKRIDLESTTAELMTFPDASFNVSAKKYYIQSGITCGLKFLDTTESLYTTFLTNLVLNNSLSVIRRMARKYFRVPILMTDDTTCAKV